MHRNAPFLIVPAGQSHMIEKDINIKCIIVIVNVSRCVSALHSLS